MMLKKCHSRQGHTTKKGREVGPAIGVIITIEEREIMIGTIIGVEIGKEIGTGIGMIEDTIMEIGGIIIITTGVVD